MNLRPRLLSQLFRPLLGRNIFRYAPSSSGAALDGRFPSARAFQHSPTAHNSRRNWLRWSVQALAWLAGFAAAAAYLMWFFKHVFDNTIR